ncbi:MAG TPA: hypothetical protein VGO67_14970 [Verrucomicrobiae bacterium]|jgi:hypothetical protein
MNTEGNIPLNVPTGILALTDVTASEKLLLALYAAEPNAKNFRAMQTLGVGLAGLKKIKRRLIDKGYLHSNANGYEVLVPGIASAAEVTGGHFVSKSSAAENDNKVAPAPARLTKDRSLAEIWDSHVTIYDQALHVDTFPHTLEMLSKKFLNFVTNEVPSDCPGRDEALIALIARRDYWFGASYASDNLPRKAQREVAKLIGKATPKQLAALRTGIECGQLAAGKPTLLLEQFSHVAGMDEVLDQTGR